jgi:hypothetical protein
MLDARARGHFSAVDYDADIECRVCGFMFRARQSLFAAGAEDFRGGLVCTKGMLEAADAVISAWTKLRQQMLPRE